mgnify:CR=1 FL=1|tara:strand:- start:14625 stop:15905 length:1281 start_codon:yes stop_codon:yes gene_type:complete
MTIKSLSNKLFCALTLMFFATGLQAAQTDHEDHEDHPDHVPLEKSASLSFVEIYTAALNNAPEILERDIRQQQARSYEAIAGNWISDRPSLELNYIDDTVLDNIGMREIEYAIQLQLKRPSELNNGRILSESYLEQSQAWERSLAHYIAGRVRSVLADISEAEANLALEQEATRNAEDLFNITNSLFDAGELSRLDVMQAENLLLNQRRTELEAEAMLVDSERNYEVLTGLNIRPDYLYTETLSDDEEIPDSHPQLLYLQSDIHLADANINMAEAQARGAPTVSLGSRRQRGNSFQSFNDSIALSLSVPFGGKNIVATKTSSARREKVDAEVIYQNTRRALNQALHEVEHELYITEVALGLSEQQKNLSEQRWQMSRTAFTQGEIALNQVIVALQEYLNAQQEYELLTLKEQRLITEYNQTIGVMP